jgi:hypothetical protein
MAGVREKENAGTSVSRKGRYASWLCAHLFLIAKSCLLQQRRNGLQDALVIRNDALPGYEHEIISQRIIPENPGYTVANLSSQSVPPYGVRQLFADRHADPEVPDLVPGIKKRKTVS